jgi:competence ComEA-like helix-hairpin-helix protein
MFYLTHHERKVLLTAGLVILSVSYFRFQGNYRYQEHEASAFSHSKKDIACPVNINTASADELEYLPGIGPRLAERILAHRRDSGPFKNKQSLIAVKGIGEKKLRAIENCIGF